MANRWAMLLDPSPANCGKMNHIQCDTLCPLRISASANGYTCSWVETNRDRSNGSADMGCPVGRGRTTPGGSVRPDGRSPFRTGWRPSGLAPAPRSLDHDLLLCHPPDAVGHVVGDEERAV